MKCSHVMLTVRLSHVEFASWSDLEVLTRAAVARQWGLFPSDVEVDIEEHTDPV